VLAQEVAAVLAQEVAAVRISQFLIACWEYPELARANAFTYSDGFSKSV